MRRSLLRSPNPWRLGVFFVVVVVVFVLVCVFAVCLFVMSMVFAVSIILAVSMILVVVVVFVVVVVDVLTARLKVGLCLCLGRTLGGWVLSLILFFLDMVASGLLCYPGFCPPREAGAASMMLRASADVGHNEEATLGHTPISANDTVRPMKADAAPMSLHSSPGTEEESGL